MTGCGGGTVDSVVPDTASQAATKEHEECKKDLKPFYEALNEGRRPTLGRAGIRGDAEADG